MPPKGGFVCNVRLWYCFRALLMISLGDENDGSEASAAAHLPLCASHPWFPCTRQSSASVTAAPKSSNTELHVSIVQKRIFPRNCVNTGPTPPNSLVELKHPVPCERKARPYPHSPLGTKVQQSHPKQRLVEQRLGLRERFLLERIEQRRACVKHRSMCHV